MGDLLNEIKNLNVSKRTRWQEVCEVLSEEELADIIEALEDPTVKTVAIIRVLKNRNVPVDRATLSKWRRGER
jgi:hypothetical protein